jgi:hypothetical protein
MDQEVFKGKLVASLINKWYFRLRAVGLFSVSLGFLSVDGFGFFTCFPKGLNIFKLFFGVGVLAVFVSALLTAYGGITALGYLTQHLFFVLTLKLRLVGHFEVNLFFTFSLIKLGLQLRCYLL